MIVRYVGTFLGKLIGTIVTALILLVVAFTLGVVTHTWWRFFQVGWQWVIR